MMNLILKELSFQLTKPFLVQEQVDKLTGELQARRRKMHGKNNDRISSGDGVVLS